MTNDVLTFTEGRVGRIRLNRPRAIHALNTAMCRAMLDALAAWERDAAIQAVLIDHADGRGFCAGGDIRMVAESGAGDGQAARDFFRTEYRLNHRLFTYPKPVIAFMDGITMGGGVGLALPGRARIATDNTRFAMPESAIGLFPDVGGGWYLSRLRGRTGQFLALTGHRLNGAECALLGLATHYVPSAALDEAKGAIAREPGHLDAILDGLRMESADTPIAAHLPLIASLFASDRLTDILYALAIDGSDWSRAQLVALRTKCPTTLKVALRQLAEGAEAGSFAKQMECEYGLAVHMAARHDFHEGVRAVIIDKDNAPKWQPATPQDVTEAMIDAIFAPLPPEEAWTPE